MKNRARFAGEPARRRPRRSATRNKATRNSFDSSALPFRVPLGLAMLLLGVATTSNSGAQESATRGTWYIKSDQSGDAPTIQAGVDSASTGDTVLLEDGVFNGPGNRDIDVLGKAISIRSESGDPSLCEVDCESLGRGFVFQSGEGPATELIGITISNGSSSSTPDPGNGGVLYLLGSSPTLRDLVIQGGQATYGGGVYCELSSPLFEDCEIVQNSANERGGGVLLEVSSGVSFTRVRISDNVAEHGGGIAVDASSPTLTDCLLQGNEAPAGASGASGGGLYARNGASPTLVGTVITGNAATNPSFGAVGGGIDIGSSTASLTACTLASNDGGVFGGAARIDASTVTFDNCLFWENCATSSPEIRLSSAASITLQCCLIDSSGVGSTGGTVIYQAPNLFSVDPIFCGPEPCGGVTSAGDYSLSSFSPCLPGSNPTCGLIGALGEGCGPRTWHILHDGTGDAPTIQAGVDASAYGDSILVEQGLYFEHVVMRPGRRLIGSWDSAFVTSDVEGQPTTIDGDSTGSCLVADFGTAQDSLGVVAGFHLTNGLGILADSLRYGGGIYSRGLLTIERCVAQGNTADVGGGLAVWGSNVTLSGVRCQGNRAGVRGGGLFLECSESALVDSVTIVANSHPESFWDRSVDGLGMSVAGGVAEIRNSTFSNNNGLFPQGSFDNLRGGGLHSDCDSAIVLDCTFLDNYLGNGDSFGAGMYATNARVERCLVRDNSVSGENSNAFGGGIYLVAGLIRDTQVQLNIASAGLGTADGGGVGGGTVRLEHCIVSDNQSSGELRGRGGGAHADSLFISNCILAGNYLSTTNGGSPAYGGGVSAGFVQMDNVVIADNTGYSNGLTAGIGVHADAGVITNTAITGGQQGGNPFQGVIGGISGPLSSRYNLFHANAGSTMVGVTDSVGHVHADPAYADPGSGDYRLLLHSPAIDQGDPSVLDPDGSRSDIGAHGGPAAVMEQPAWVQNLVWSGSAGCGVALDWQANGEPDLTGYAVYRAGVPGVHPGLATFLATSSVESFVDRNAYPLISYSYRVSAYDSSGYGGGYSSEASLAAEPWEGDGVPVGPSTGLAVEGVSNGGQFGAGLASGDLDDDGVDDLVVSSRGSGSVSIFFGAPGFAPSSEAQADVVLAVPTGVPFGGVLATGDVDGDLIADLVVGVPSESPLGRSGAGAAFLYLGREDWSGTVLPDVVVLGASDGERVSDSAAIGDLNDDGFAELVLGAPEAASGLAPHDGKVEVVFGSSSLPDTVDLASYPHLMILANTAGLFSGDRLGSALASDDFTGDGIGDLLIGARAEDSKGLSATGAAHLIAGYSGLEALSVWDLTTTAADLRVDGVGSDDQLGVAVAAVDADGDGASEIVVGAWQAERRDGVETGAIYMIRYADAESTVVDLATDEVWLTLYGRSDGAVLGSTLTGGRPAPNGAEGLWAGARGVSGGEGAAYALWGGRPCLPAWIDMDLSAMDLEMTGPAHVAGADPLLGSALAIGDFNDDGRQDYAAGAYGADPGATDAGLVLIALDLDPVFTPIVTASEPLNPRVSSAWPNPSRGIVSLNINSNGTAPTRLDVYDVSGRRVWSSVHSTTSGVGRIEWAGRDLAGRSASPGTYFLRVQLEGEVFERKVTLLR